MKYTTLLALLFSTLISVSHAKEPSNNGVSTSVQPKTENDKQTIREEIYERAKKRNGGKEPTKLDLFNELMQKAAEETGAIEDYGKPRIVARGAKPEIIIKGDQITINGQPVGIGKSIEIWKRAMPGKPRCEKEYMDVICEWDGLGIKVYARSGGELAVLEFKTFLNLQRREAWDIPATSAPDGTKILPPNKYQPSQSFPGYLELDGFGIDAKTKFWEIRANADPKRNLRCDPRDCSHPHGGFSNKANLYLRLNKADEYGNLYEFTIAADPRTEPLSKK
jgi:hypothetical protein